MTGRGSRTSLVAILACVLGVGVASATSAQEFSYNGDDGPDFWWEIDADWEACAGDGMAQSPIDISNTRPDRSLGRLDLLTVPTTIDIINNGHTIEQRYEDTGTSIRFEGVEYELTQFHFHTLSEHTVLGSHAVMEMHGVFSAEGGTNLVIGQLFEIGNKPNSFIQTLIDAGLPEKDGLETITSAPIDFGDGLVDTRFYFTYQGSLTTPPCSEVVTWVVLKRSASLSAGQFGAFRRILGNNFRPIQDTHDRVVRATVGGQGAQPMHRGND